MVSGADDETLVTYPASRPAEADLKRGELLGRYVVLGRLGAGGMGVVYTAYDPELDRKLAVKLMRSLGGADGSTTGGSARLLREAQAMAKLQHPNVVSVHDVGQHEGHVFIAMEFIEGKTLSEWLAEQKPSWREIVRVLRFAGEGLAAAHEKGIVHRDFKPDNVMITDDGRVRVLDFGLARAAANQASESETEPQTTSGESPLNAELTRAGSMVGTPAYMSPEQHLSEEVKPASDQFSFAVTAYFALFGERPFAGDRPAAIAFNVIEGRIRQPSDARGVARRIRAVVARGLSRHAEDRWPSMRAMLDQLARDPSRRRRRLLAAGSLVAVAGAVFGFNRFDHGRQVERCRADAASISEVWDESTRAQLHTTLAESGSELATFTADQTVSWLDRYAEEWSKTREAACLSATTEGAQSERVYELGVACLEEHREALASLVATLSAGDAQSLSRAVPAAAGLPLIESCQDEQHLNQRAARPQSQTDRVAARQIESQLQEAKSLLALGQHSRARSKASDAAGAAEQLGWPPLIARAHYEVALALEQEAKYEDAERELRVAMLDALRAGDDELVAAAGGQLGYVLSHELNRTDEAGHWIDLADAALDRSGMQDGLARARWLGQAATIDLSRGDVEDADEKYSRALAITRDTLGEEHPRVGSAALDLGNAKTVIGDWRAYKRLALDAIAIEIKTLGADHPRLGRTYTNLAQAHARLGEFPDAQKAARRALEITEANYPPEHPDVGKALVTLSNTLDDEDEKLDLLSRALPIMKNAMGEDHPWVGRVENNLALIHIRADRTTEAIALLEHNLDILRKVKSADHPDLAMVYFNLAKAESRDGQHAKALEHATLALEMRQKSLGLEHRHTAYAEQVLGVVLERSGDVQAALVHWERALASYEKEGVMLPELAGARFDIARVLWDTKRDRKRALELARSAAVTYAEIGDHAKEERQAVDDWLTAHDR